MDVYSFLLGIFVAVAGGLLLRGAVLMIERPILKVLPEIWRERKWVGFLRGNIKYLSTTVADIAAGEAKVDGYDFDIYGISIQNQHRLLFPRKTAHVTKTTIAAYNARGDQVNKNQECRWWSHDLSSIDKLFVPREVDLAPRQTQNISEDVTAHLAIVYRHVGQTDCRLFVIDSDRVGRFNANEDRIKGPPPYYLHVEIKGDNIRKSIWLELNPTDDSLSIKEVRAPLGR